MIPNLIKYIAILWISCVILLNIFLSKYAYYIPWI